MRRRRPSPASWPRDSDLPAPHPCPARPRVHGAIARWVPCTACMDHATRSLTTSRRSTRRSHGPASGRVATRATCCWSPRRRRSPPSRSAGRSRLGVTAIGENYVKELRRRPRRGARRAMALHRRAADQHRAPCRGARRRGPDRLGRSRHRAARPPRGGARAHDRRPDRGGFHARAIGGRARGDASRSPIASRRWRGSRSAGS